MILGFFFVRPVPLPEAEPIRQVYLDTSSSFYKQRNDSRTSLLNHDLHIQGRDDDDDARIGVEANPSLRGRNCETSTGRSLDRGAGMALDLSPNVFGKKLWCSGDFWLLFTIQSIRMFIYNLFCSFFFLIVLCSKRDWADVYVIPQKNTL